MKALALLLALTATAAAQTYPCGPDTGGATCAGPIPDFRLHAGVPGTIESSLTVPPGGACGTASAVAHVDARVDALHDWSGDLRVTLFHPDGTAAIVLAPRDLILDDLGTAYAVPAGAFAGKARAGTWKLRIEDTARHGIGALVGWSVVFPCPDVKIAAGDGSAGPSPSDTGSFTVTRTGATDVALDVAVTYGGSAGAGDVAPLPATVTIPVGSASAAITVAPIDDGLDGEPAETVVATLAAGGYTVNALNSATVTLVADGDSPPPDAAPPPDAPLAQPDAAPPDAAPLPDAPPAPPDASPAADAAAMVEEASDGCGCRTGGRGGPGALLLAVALCLVWRRRRRG